MAEDNTKLIIVLEAQSKKLQNSLASTNRIIDRFAAQTERRFDQMNAKNEASFVRLEKQAAASSRNMQSALAPLLGALGVKEISGYADAWQDAQNKINAAASVSGTQARSLESLRVGADGARQSLSDYVDLYSRLLRVAPGVQASEEQVAKATDIVAKSLKAGGASAQEQGAALIQLGQALGSGFLQGDELRSIRENAPLLAQAIASEFKVSIGELKKLGSEGKITSDRVFKAILAAGPMIGAAFDSTDATIGDSYKRVENALTQYIGSADQSKGATYALKQGLTALANDFGNFADIALKVAAILAAQFVGKAIGGMIAQLGAAGIAVARFVSIAKSAQSVGGLLSAFGGLGAAAGPIGAVIGTIAAGAVLYFGSQAAIAAERSAALNKEMLELGLITPKAAGGVDKVTKSLDEMTEADRIRKVQKIREELDAIKNGGSGDLGNLTNILGGGVADADLKNLDAVSTRAGKNSGLFTSGEDNAGYAKIKELVASLQTIPGYSQQARAELEALKNTNVSQGVVDLADTLDSMAQRIGALEGPMTNLYGGSAKAIEAATFDVANLFGEVDNLHNLHMISDEQFAELDAVRQKFMDGTASADETKHALESIQDANPSMADFIGRMDGVIAKLVGVIGVANQAKAAVSSVTGISADIKTFREADAASMDKLKTLNDANTKFTTEAERRAKLTEKQKALEDKITDVRARAAKAGGYLSSEQAGPIAQMELDQKDGFKADKKAANKGKNAYQTETASVQKRTAALVAQTEAQKGLNPFVDDYGYAVAKAESKQELLTAAEEAGVKLTPEVRANIDKIAEGFAQATVESEKLKQSQDELHDKIVDAFATAKDVARGFIDDLVSGKSAAESLGNALSKIGDKLLDMGLDSLLGTGSGENPLGMIGKLFGFKNGGIAANGRPKMFANGGVSNTASVFGEAGPEAAVPLPDGRSIPVSLKMPKVSSNSGAVHVTYAPQIDAHGADSSAVARLAQIVAQDKADFSHRVVGAVRDAKRKRWI